MAQSQDCGCLLPMSCTTAQTWSYGKHFVLYFCYKYVACILNNYPFFSRNLNRNKSLFPDLFLLSMRPIFPSIHFVHFKYMMIFNNAAYLRIKQNNLDSALILVNVTTTDNNTSSPDIYDDVGNYYRWTLSQKEKQWGFCKKNEVFLKEKITLLSWFKYSTSVYKHKIIESRILTGICTLKFTETLFAAKRLK